MFGDEFRWARGLEEFFRVGRNLSVTDARVAWALHRSRSPSCRLVPELIVRSYYMLRSAPTGPSSCRAVGRSGPTPSSFFGAVNH